MSYNKTTWQNGDIITAEKLNNIETGLSNRAVICTWKMDADPQEPASMTSTEIIECLNNGQYVFVIVSKDTQYGFQYLVYYVQQILNAGGQNEQARCMSLSEDGVFGIYSNGFVNWLD